MNLINHFLPYCNKSRTRAFQALDYHRSLDS